MTTIERRSKQLEALAEYAIHYSNKEAAHCMGLSINTFKHLLYEGLSPTGTTLEAFHDLGWLTVPPDLVSKRHPTESPALNGED